MENQPRERRPSNSDVEKIIPHSVFVPYDLINGSAGAWATTSSLRYPNPAELVWAGMIKFNHDFVGRKAFEKGVANPRRKMVTLAWNKEDIIDVYISQFQPGDPYANMDHPNVLDYKVGTGRYRGNQVLKDGKLVGISSGRAYSYYLSLTA
jgi:hypothetical protein